MKGKMPDEGINPVEFPAIMRNAWEWFNSLSMTRTPGFAGPGPITYTELHAFFSLHGITPEPWEISAIRLLDILAMKSFADTSK